MNTPRAYLCDFDGTIAPVDIGAAFVRRFTTLPGHELERVVALWRGGQIGTRQVLESESQSLAVSEAEALAFTRGFALDPHFSPFVGEVRAFGDRVVVMSEGYDFYVRDQLERAGLGDLPWTANRACFDGRRVRVEHSAEHVGCEGCGNCKAAEVERQRTEGYEVVLVGDGLSDRCGARIADWVFARGQLLEWCGSMGIVAHPFDTFADLIEAARALSGRPSRSPWSVRRSRPVPATRSGDAPPARPAPENDRDTHR